VTVVIPSGIWPAQTESRIARSPRATASNSVSWQFAALGAVSAGDPGKTRERSPLSTREREVVQFIAQGYKNKEMAEKMFISEQTVKNYLHNIFDKLGVSDRLELALYAIHKGLHLTADPIRGAV
jgi:DNA-binding NarL/FixJ family response regulator